MSSEKDHITIPVPVFEQMQDAAMKASVASGKIAAMMTTIANVLCEVRDELRFIRQERRDVWPLIERLRELSEDELERLLEAAREEGRAQGRAEAPVASALSRTVSEAILSEKGKATVKALVLTMLAAGVAYVAVHFGVTP